MDAAVEPEIRAQAPAAVEALARVGRDLAATLDFAQASDRIVQTVLQLFRGSQAALYELDRPSGDLVCVAVAGESDPARWVGVRLRPGEGVTGRAVLDRRPVWSPDVLADPWITLPEWAAERGWLEGYRSVAAVPLILDGEILGALALTGPEGNILSSANRRLLSAFADQAALALHRARLSTASERRRRAAEGLAEVGQLISQSLDPEEVSQRIAESLRRMLPAGHVAVFELDPESGNLVARTVAGDAGAIVGPGAVLEKGTGVAGLAIQERGPVLTPDLLADPRIALTPETRARVERSPYRAVLAVPLVAQDRVIGALGAGAEGGRTFGEEEIWLAQSFANQAALALENARHYEEADRRRREAEVVTDLARSINASLDLDTVLQRVTEAAKDLCGSDLAQMFLRDANAEVMGGRYWVGGRNPAYETVRVEPGRGVGGQVLVTGRPFRTASYADDPRFSKDYLPMIEAEGIIATLAVPIRIEGRIEGLLFVDNRSPRPFTDRDEAILVQLAEHAAIAIRNAELFEREQTARARAEASEGLLRMTLEAADMVAWSWDVATGEVRRVASPTRLGQLQLPSTGTGEEFLALIHPDDRDRVRAEIAAALEGCATIDVEYRLTAGDGSSRWFADRGRVVCDHAGTPLRVSGVGIDVTARKQAEEARGQLEAQLRQAQKVEAVGQLAGGVAHDFNNLLTVIAGRSELLRERLAPEDPNRRAVKLIQETAERAARLTRQLLAFSRKQVLQPQVLDLSAVVAGMEKMLRRLIGEDVELVSDLDPRLGPVKADPAQLEQVILNLALNARDAMPRGGRLTLETANIELDEVARRERPDVRPGPYVRLTVRDTGVGMDAATRAHMFEPFFTTKPPGKGTGLGLATVYGIVTQSGGHIEVESALGRGTTFTIYLPRVEAAAEVREPRAAAPAPGGSETVLLVEDAEEVRELAREVLEASGYTVLEAANGGEALELAARQWERIQLLLTDVVMPQMSGRELAARLAATHPTAKTLFMSGYTDDSLGRHGVLDQGIHLLQKPFTPDALARKVRNVLDGGPGGSSAAGERERA